MQRNTLWASCERVWRWALASGLAAFTTYGVSAQSITWIQPPPDTRYGPTTAFLANLGGLSEDGSVLVQASDQPVAYYWKAGVGWIPAGAGYNFADASADGNILVGIAPLNNNYGQPAYYNVQNGAWFLMGLPATGSHAYALSCSQDGTVIVGVYSTGTWHERPFRWQNNTYTLLPIPPNTDANAIYAVGVSPDGSVAVGCTYFDGGNVGLPDALRWDGTQLTVLPKLHPQGSAWAVDASLQGQVIVGGAGDPISNSFEPVRWDNNNIRRLPKGEFPHAIAHSVTRTGQVVSGSAWDSLEIGAAVRWSACGFENLNETYVRLLGDGERLLTAHLLTQSGRYIAGFGTRNNMGVMYILDTGKCWDPAGNVDADCCVDDADLLQVLFDFGRQEDGLATDLNCDGIVDDADLLIVLFNFGQGC